MEREVRSLWDQCLVYFSTRNSLFLGNSLLYLILTVSSPLLFCFFPSLGFICMLPKVEKVDCIPEFSPLSGDMSPHPLHYPTESQSASVWCFFRWQCHVSKLWHVIMHIAFILKSFKTSMTRLRDVCALLIMHKTSLLIVFPMIFSCVLLLGSCSEEAKGWILDENSRLRKGLKCLDIVSKKLAMTDCSDSVQKWHFTRAFT